MSSSVTRADVSSWQLREVTTNPISSSPRLRSTTAKRPDAEGGSGTRHSGTWRSREGEGGAGSGRGRGGNKGTELNCWSDFLRGWRDLCQSGLNRASSPRSRMADEAARSPADWSQPPTLKACSTWMLAVLGDESASHPLSSLPPALPLSSACSTHCPDNTRTSGADGRGTWGTTLGRGGAQKTGLLEVMEVEGGA